MGIDGLAAVLITPAPKHVKVFQAEAEWIHLIVARSTLGLGTMGFQLGAQGDQAGFCGCLVKRGDVGRWRVHFLAEQSFHDPATAQDRARAQRE